MKTNIYVLSNLPPAFYVQGCFEAQSDKGPSSFCFCPPRAALVYQAMFQLTTLLQASDHLPDADIPFNNRNDSMENLQIKTRTSIMVGRSPHWNPQQRESLWYIP